MKNILLSLKTTLKNATEFLVSQILRIVEFIVTQVIKIANFIATKAAETVTIMTAINQLRHPIVDSIDYAILCATSVVLAYIILKKGDVDIEKIGGFLEKFKSKKDNKDAEK